MILLKVSKFQQIKFGLLRLLAHACAICFTFYAAKLQQIFHIDKKICTFDADLDDFALFHQHLQDGRGLTVGGEGAHVVAAPAEGDILGRSAFTSMTGTLSFASIGADQRQNAINMVISRCISRLNWSGLRTVAFYERIVANTAVDSHHRSTDE